MPSRSANATDVRGIDPKKSASDVKRFWSYVIPDPAIYPEGGPLNPEVCWLWTGPTRNNIARFVYYHYGARDFRVIPPIRFAYLLTVGDYPTDDRGRTMFPQPGCQNPLCINPHHAAFATRKNVRKLTDAQEQKIRELREEDPEFYTHRRLSRQFNVHSGTIARVLNGYAYENLEDEDDKE